MNAPMLLSQFRQLPPTTRALALDGLSGLIDLVAEASPDSHRFLRFQWFAAAIAAYGGQARTIVVEADGEPVIALPMARFGPAAVRLAAVPGSYWPFRSFPSRAGIAGEAFRALLATLGQEVNALRIGPVYDSDPSAAPLREAARAAGWAVLDRFVATSFVLDLAAQGEDWPRASTLRKNRYHEKHLAEHGELEWTFLSGETMRNASFDAFDSIERTSWIATRTDASDAKFTADGHGAFWRRAASDPVLAGMMSAALLRVDGVPAAFSFDLDAGRLRYAIANSYDPAFAKCSPGKLLHYRNLVRARQDGIGLVDWGAGDSGYKQALGAEQGPVLRDWLLVRPGLPAMLGRALRHVWERSGQTATVA